MSDPSGGKTAPRIRRSFRIKETIVTILAGDPAHIGAAEREILQRRAELERYIAANPYFAATLEPWPADPRAPDIVKKMIDAGNAAGIGPMSAVAGTIAYFAVSAMKKEGAAFALVDNGGDIAAYNPRSKGNGPLTVGIYTGFADDSLKNIGLRFPPTPDDDIFGICTSSGTVGPSVSFGVADAAVVISKDVSLADAAATALGNAFPETGIDDDDTSKRIRSALSSVSGIRTDGAVIDGALLIKGKNIGLLGNIPEFVRVDVAWDTITKA